MSIAEAALVFDRWGVPIHWHVPPDRSEVYLPDSRNLWEILWKNREDLGGVAHTHPWTGEPSPSHTDVTTFSGLELGLGKKLVWPIVTLTDIIYLTWKGPGKYDYGHMTGRRFRLHPFNIEKLIDISTGGHHAERFASGAGAGGPAKRDLQRPER
jgi:hypothetical protein